VLQQGEAPAAPDALYVDCSAGAIQPPPDVPVFDGNRINLLMVRFCQPTFSAALIAYVASHFDDPDERNALCAPVPSPELPSDWLRMWAATLVNMARWRQDPALSRWLSACRLNMNAVVMRPVRPDDAERIALAREAAAKAGALGGHLSRLMATIAAAPQGR
jgi:hypothetical protein